MLKLLQAVQGIRYSLWFVPSAIILGAIALALLAVDADSRVGTEMLSRWPRLFGASAEGARSMLHVIASAMITVGALTFSITMLVLSSAASQYTPRVIRTFMRSRTTQAVLGIFLGIFVYCLIVLRTIRGNSDSFVPSISVTIAILLALVGVGVLVYFIHHIAWSIQASTIVFAIANDTLRVIDRTFKNDDAGNSETSSGSAEHERDWFPVNAASTGYLRTLDMPALIDYARKNDLVVKLSKTVGDFVVKESPLVLLSREPESEMERELNKLYVLGQYRTVEQDVSVGIQQLVDIALKAMSPAINDTTTALLCIDNLSAIIIRLSRCTLQPQWGADDGKHVIGQRVYDFGNFLAIAFEQIRMNAKDSFAVYVHLLESLARIADCTLDARRRQQVERQIRLVWEYARSGLEQPDQLAIIIRRVNQGLAKHGRIS